MLHQRRRKHSQKPDIVREWINLWYPKEIKLELFARKEKLLFEDENFENWDFFGNEVENSITLERKK